MKPRKILAFLSVATLLVVSLLLVACGDDTPAGSGAAVATTTASGSTTTAAANSQNNNAGTTSAANNGAANGNPGMAGSFGEGTPGVRRGGNGTPGARFNGTPGAGRNGTPGARFNGTPGANFAQQMTPENVVNRLYTDFKNSQLSQIDNVLVSQKLRDSLGQQADQQLGVMMGLSSGQKLDSFTVDTPSVNGNNATVKVTLKLSDGSTITDNLSLVKSTFSFNGRPPAQNGANGQPNGQPGQGQGDPNGNPPPADANGNNPPPAQNGQADPNASGTPGPNGNGNGAQFRGPREVWQIDQITASK